MECCPHCEGDHLFCVMLGCQDRGPTLEEALDWAFMLLNMENENDK